jgi:hypothetical protein
LVCLRFRRLGEYFVQIGSVEVFIFWGKKALQLVACKGHMCQLQNVQNKLIQWTFDMHLTIEHETRICQLTSALPNHARYR